MYTRSLFIAFLATIFSIPTVSSRKIQKDGLVLPPNASENRDAVRNIFLKSYKAYKYVTCVFPCVLVLIYNRKSAWGHDDLGPLSNRGNGLLSVLCNRFIQVANGSFQEVSSTVATDGVWWHVSPKSYWLISKSQGATIIDGMGTMVGSCSCIDDH